MDCDNVICPRVDIEGVRGHIGIIGPIGPIGGPCCNCGGMNVKYDADTGVSYCDCGWNNRKMVADNYERRVKNGEISSGGYRDKYLEILSGMTINVLGTEYTITVKKYDEDEAFERSDIGGYCTALTRSIVVCDMRTYEGLEHETPEALDAYTKKNLRHEIVHAFLEESGLSDNSSTIEGWARNEEMVDWIAIQGPKIYKAWQEAGVV